MFDLSNLDFVQVDHLLADTRYRVLRDFQDASGTRHAKGDVFLYRSAHLNMTAQRLTLRVEDGEGNKSEWRIDYGAGDGPKPGNLKEYLEDAGYVGITPEARAKQREADAPPPREPREAPDSIGEPRLAEVYALALRGEFEAAGALLNEVDDARALGDYHLEKLAGWLANAAHAAGDTAAAEWLGKQAMNQWEFWASCSTSGGEGAARSRELAKIRRELGG